jgi:glycosyl transferase, family 25
MKIYVISLERATERRLSIKNQMAKLNLEYEIIDAVDGRTMNDQDIQKAVDENVYNWYKTESWMPCGVIGCTLSHVKFFEKFLESNSDWAVIIEDDVILYNDFEKVINAIAKQNVENEVTLLFYQTAKVNEEIIILQNTRKDLVDSYSLYQPKDMNKVGSTAGYIVSRKVAKKLLYKQKPMSCVSDWWGQYHKSECFEKLNLVYPLVMEPGTFASTLDYYKKFSLHSISLALLSKLPLIKDIILKRRKRNFNNLKRYKFI